MVLEGMESRGSLGESFGLGVEIVILLGSERRWRLGSRRN